MPWSTNFVNLLFFVLLHIASSLLIRQCLGKDYFRLSTRVFISYSRFARGSFGVLSREDEAKRCLILCWSPLRFRRYVPVGHLIPDQPLQSGRVRVWSMNPLSEVTHYTNKRTPGDQDKACVWHRELWSDSTVWDVVKLNKMKSKYRGRW